MFTFEQIQVLRNAMNILAYASNNDITNEYIGEAGQISCDLINAEIPHHLVEYFNETIRNIIKTRSGRV